MCSTFTETLNFDYNAMIHLKGLFWGQKLFINPGIWGCRQKFPLEGVAYIQSKKKNPNTHEYFRPWWILIGSRYGMLLMQLFTNSKNMTLARIRLWCPAPHKIRHPPQLLPYIRTFVRRFWICDQEQDKSLQSRDTVKFKNCCSFLPPGGNSFHRKVRLEIYA